MQVLISFETFSSHHTLFLSIYILYINIYLYIYIDMIFFCSPLLYQEVMPRYDPEIRSFHFVVFLVLFFFLDNFRLLLLLFLFLYCFVTPYNMERGLVCKLADSCLSIQWETKEEDKAYYVYGILDRICHRILNDFSIFPFFFLFICFFPKT